MEKADIHKEAARSALRAIFEESDSWRRYTDEYEEQMGRYVRWLSCSILILLLLALIFLCFQRTFLYGLLFAGAAGSCASVMSKVPVLEVSLSGELESYGRRIFSRISTGVVASIIGTALLGWGVIAISV